MVWSELRSHDLLGFWSRFRHVTYCFFFHLPTMMWIYIHCRVRQTYYTSPPVACPGHHNVAVVLLTRNVIVSWYYVCWESFQWKTSAVFYFSQMPEKTSIFIFCSVFVSVLFFYLLEIRILEHALRAIRSTDGKYVVNNASSSEWTYFVTDFTQMKKLHISVTFG